MGQGPHTGGRVAKCLQNHIQKGPPSEDGAPWTRLVFQITWTAGAVAKNCSLSNAAEKQEVVVSYLPLSHVAAQMMDVWIPMKIGAFIYFAQPDALTVRLRAAPGVSGWFCQAPDSGVPALSSSYAPFRRNENS